MCQQYEWCKSSYHIQHLVGLSRFRELFIGPVMTAKDLAHCNWVGHDYSKQAQDAKSASKGLQPELAEAGSSETTVTLPVYLYIGPCSSAHLDRILWKFGFSNIAKWPPRYAQGGLGIFRKSPLL